jgi:eukaryotic-like serine/threonine-protein kinase
MDTTLSRLQPGQLLDGRYRVGSWIARGGMATVYLGTDTKLDRTVALKIAHPELTGDRDFVRRFATEARAAARLSSPNVVAVYDQGADAGLLYLAMEYVPGRTLRELLTERGRLRPGEALDIFQGVLAGLAAAHRAGLVHRDVKPENVLIGHDGTVKVADFGLARAASANTHTATGMIIGTAAYLAPEQVTRSASDARTDVYAAGVMLFELVTGTQPHTGDSPLAVAHKHVSEVVPAPSSLVPLPRSLDALVAMATSRDPALRPADAEVFLRAVTEARRGLDNARPAAAAPPLPAAGIVSRDQRVPGGPRPDGDSWFPWPGEDRRATSAIVPSRAGGGMSHTLIVPAGPMPPAEPVLQRWLFSRRLVYVALGVAAAVIIGVVTWWVTDGQYATVPQVAGMAAGPARAELQNLGFGVQVKREHNPLAAGDVVRTLPEVGASVHRGSTVTIIESIGPVMITVPNVTGMQQAAAEAALRRAGLTPGPVTQTGSSTVPTGEVVSTNPPPGVSWPQTKPVSLTVSAGPPLPNFVGQQFQAAQGQAQSGGYQLQEVAAVNSNQPQGTIVGQSPPPGTPITPNEVVTVQVSNGPAQVAIPSVSGDSVQQATQILQQAGFQVTVNQQGPFGGNTVQSTSPSGQAPQGSTITLNVGRIFP